MDRLLIQELHCRCIIGLRPQERREKQDVTINVALFADLAEAGRTDRIDDTVDYRAIKLRILEMVEASQFSLLEALAQAVADICLSEPRLLKVRVQIEKPAALRFARSAGVQIVRRRKEAT